jgi:hypothetical protein
VRNIWFIVRFAEHPANVWSSVGEKLVTSPIKPNPLVFLLQVEPTNVQAKFHTNKQQMMKMLSLYTLLFLVLPLKSFYSHFEVLS